MKSNKLIKFNLKDLNTSHSALLLVSLENIKKNYKFLKKKVNNSDLGISIKASSVYKSSYVYAMCTKSSAILPSPSLIWE